MKEKKLKKLIYDCYEEMFQASTPKASFYELLEEAETNEEGQKVIPFMDYEMSPKDFEDILNKYAKKVKPEYFSQGFRTTIILGCSPKCTYDKIPDKLK